MCISTSLIPAWVSVMVSIVPSSSITTSGSDWSARSTPKTSRTSTDASAVSFLVDFSLLLVLILEVDLIFRLPFPYEMPWNIIEYF
jgi:hypothetical protein